MFDKIKQFILDIYFFNVSEKEKEEIRERVMKEDHRPYATVLAIVFFLQVFMIIRSFINYGFDTHDKPWVLWYRIVYSSLALACILFNYLSKLCYKKNKTFAYFSIVNTVLIFIIVWGAAITILDSYQTIDLTTFSYVCLSMPLFIILEPWIASIDYLVVIVALNLYFYYNPSAQYGSGVLINSLSIFILAIVGCTFVFYRRIKRIKSDVEIETLNHLLEKRVIIDDLTKLYNRYYLTDHLSSPLITDGMQAGIMMIDIDHFKKINDDYGHKAGDEILRQIGKMILDFVGDDGYAVRYGGEEFLVYFNNTNPAQLFTKGEELRNKFEDTNVKVDKGINISFTVSIGLAMSNNNITYSGLISLADKALYKAKETRNTVSFK